MKANKPLRVGIAGCGWTAVEHWGHIYGMEENQIHSALLTKYGAGGESRPRRVLDNLSQSYQHLACTASAAFYKMLGKYHTSHCNLIERFVESIRNDSTPPVTGEEGREVVRAWEEITAQIGNKLS